MNKLIVGPCALVASLALAAGASAAPSAHGRLLHPSFNANESSNWFGYNQGALDNPLNLFNSIGGDWTVPTVTQHTAAQAESSSDWIGIGGGCIESSCTATDSTLIQTGTEQDVDAAGAASYSAWWEIVPAPEISISMNVSPGDHMHVLISEVVPDLDLWTITLQDVTQGESFTTTVPYPSTHLSAEWIEETPLEIGTDAGFASLPNLSDPGLFNAATNGVNANLQTSQQMFLTDSNGNIIGRARRSGYERSLRPGLGTSIAPGTTNHVSRDPPSNVRRLAREPPAGSRAGRAGIPSVGRMRTTGCTRS